MSGLYFLFSSVFWVARYFETKLDFVLVVLGVIIGAALAIMMTAHDEKRRIEKARFNKRLGNKRKIAKLNRIKEMDVRYSNLTISQ